MISKLGQVVLYVNDQDQVLNFWTEKMGFQVISEVNDGQGMRFIEVAPAHGGTSLVLHNKEWVAKFSPGVNLGSPSLMFLVEDLDQLHADLTSKQVTVGEIVSVPEGRVFNFADCEGNYYAIMESSR